MAKNNHHNTELDDLFFDQFNSMDDQHEERLEHYLGIAATYARMESCISVLSDLKERKSHIFYGFLGEDLGIAREGTRRQLDTIWEDEILCRINESDLRRKQKEEMKFFTFVKKKQDDAYRFYMKSSFPMKDSVGNKVPVTHRIFYFHDENTIRYALCLYNASSSYLEESTIVDSRNGEEISLCKIDLSKMISEREKEVLTLISKGLSSKEIACHLGISVYTVSRHRQNIIAAMNVKNCSQACQLAHQMGLMFQ